MNSEKPKKTNFKAKIKKIKIILKPEFYEDALVAVLKFFIKRNPISPFYAASILLSSSLDGLIEKEKEVKEKKSFRELSNNFSTHHPYLSAASSFIFLVLLTGGIFWAVFNKDTQQAKADWWNDSWSYRKSVPVTNNTTEETDVYIAVTIDTSDTTKFQADCGDLRFTKYIGGELPYYVSSGCGTASTVVHVNFETLLAGAQTIYYYYGNPSAPNGFETSGFSTLASNYTIGTIGSEEVGGGPVGYWSFDEGYGTTAHDESSEGNDGTISGATWQTEDQCVVGKCLYFDGNDDYIDTNSVVYDADSDNITISAWMKTVNQDTGQYILGERGDPSGNTGYALQYRGNAVGDPLRYTLYGIVDQDSSATGIEESEWVNVVITYDKQFIRFYKNGSLLSSHAQTSAVQPATRDLFIGAANEYGTADSFFEGYLDEIKIYPYARTVDQVRQDYNAGLAGAKTGSGTSLSFGGESNKWMSDGLVGYWKMDESGWNGTVDEVVDSSGNGNHLTGSGDATTGGAKFGNGGVFSGNINSNASTGGSSTDLDFERTDSFSIFTWVKGVSDSGTIIGKMDPSDAYQGYDIYTNASTWNVNIRNAANTNAIDVNGSSDIVDDSWHLVGFTYDGSSSASGVKLYVDGEDDTGTVDVDNLTGSISGLDDFSIGARESESSVVNSEFAGSIDEARVYNRVLSPGEVKRLYQWAPGPVLHLKMNEKVSGDAQTLYDVSGNENNGTTEIGGNGTGMDCVVPGKYGSACEFDGVDDYVIVSDSSSIDFSAGESWSVSAWVKTSTCQADDSKFVEKKELGNEHYILECEGNVANFNVRDSNFVGANALGTVTITDNEWHHLQGIKDGNNLYLYVDGILDGSDSASFTGSWGDGDLRIGDGVDGGARKVAGIVDEVRIYNYARTQKQVLEDMNGGKPASNSPVAYWKFDELYGDTAHDESGNGNDGAFGAGSAAPSWDRDGKMRGAIEFDGTNDQIVVSDSSSLQIGSDSSISAWVNYPGDSSYEFILEKSDGDDSDDAYAFYINNNILEVEFTDGGMRRYNATDTIPLNEWVHVMVVFDDTSDEIRFYVNGKEDSGGPVSTTYSIQDTNTGDLYIGRQKWTGDTNPLSAFFSGSIDEVKIFNYVLSEDEIKQEYSGGSVMSFGSTGTDSSGNPTNSASREYCVPGDSSQCDAPLIELDFDEKTGTTVYDKSGNGNDGTLGGDGAGTDLPTWDRGNYGGGLRFDGTNDYVEIAEDYAGEFNFDYVTDDVTVEAWVKPDSIGTEQTILVRGNFSTYSPYAVFITPSGAVKSGWSTGITGSTVLQAGEWNHVVWTETHGVSNRSRLYVNGVLDSVASNSLISDTDNYDISIGAGITDDGAMRFFDGVIDGVKVYDYARTPEQIAWDYNKGAPVAEWRFDEGQNSTAHDESGNGNDGTISGSSWESGSSCKKNGCLSMDSTADEVEVSSSGLPDLHKISVSGWVNTANSSGDIVYREENSSFDVTRTGFFQTTNSSTVGTTSISSIPAEADILVILMPGSSSVTRLNWNTSNVNLFTLLDSASSVSGADAQVYYMTSDDPNWPTTPKTLYWTVSGSGSWKTVAAAFYKNVDINNPFSSSAKNESPAYPGGTTTWTTSLTSNSAYDRGVIIAADWDGVDTAPAGYSQTELVGRNDLGIAEGSLGDTTLRADGNYVLTTIAFILRADTGLTTNSYYLGLTGGNPTFKIFQNSTEYTVTGSSTVNDNAWHHLMGTYDGSQMRLYVDGHADGTNSAPSGDLDVSYGNLYMGKNFSSGYVDEIEIYNYPLTPAQVLPRYNRGVTRFR